MIPKRVNALAVIIIALICEGSLYYSDYRGYHRAHIKFANSNKKLNDIFAYCMKKEFRAEPTTNKEYDGVLYTEYSKKTAMEITHNLLKNSPTFTTYPYKKTSAQYLSLPQPTIAYVLSQNIETRKYCLRFAMSCEGAITFSRKKNGSMRASLSFGCSNPNLIPEWEKLFESMDIQVNIKHDNDIWSGINGLRTTKNADLKKFDSIGGFIEGTKTCRGKYFKGIEKNPLIKKVLTFNSKRPIEYNKWSTPKLMEYLAKDLQG